MLHTICFTVDISICHCMVDEMKIINKYPFYYITLYYIKVKQEVLWRNNCLLSFDITRTAWKKTRPTISLLLRVYSFPKNSTLCSRLHANWNLTKNIFLLFLLSLCNKYISNIPIHQRSRDSVVGMAIGNKTSIHLFKAFKDDFFSTPQFRTKISETLHQFYTVWNLRVDGFPPLQAPVAGGDLA
jgi:hypothetical protein